MRRFCVGGIRGKSQGDSGQCRAKIQEIFFSQFHNNPALPLFSCFRTLRALFRLFKLLAWTKAGNCL
ncbi:hypothetical protein RBY4I_246 [Rhodobacterales bacterium Y4I]|nr:hypothetical protein RBY4I_246 [Rhodobacterales bacterium Y4I]